MIGSTTLTVIAIIAVLSLATHLFLKGRLNNENFKQSFKEPYEMLGLPIVRVIFNGKYINFLVDSGANINYLDSEFARYISGIPECPIKTEVKDGTKVIHTSGGDVVVEDIKHYLDFEFLGVKHKGIKFTDASLEPMQAISLNTGYEIMGVLGSDFLYENQIEINYKELVVKL